MLSERMHIDNHCHHRRERSAPSVIGRYFSVVPGAWWVGGGTINHLCTCVRRKKRFKFNANTRKSKTVRDGVREKRKEKNNYRNKLYEWSAKLRKCHLEQETYDE